MAPTRSRRVVAAVAGGVAVADWATKAVAASTLDDGPVHLGDVLTLRLGHNPGVAFGVGDQLPGALVVAATAAATVVLAVAAFRGAFASSAGSGLVLGGAVANLADRVVGGTVVDFLDLGWWPSFNLADIALTTGGVLLVLSSFREPVPGGG